MRYDIKNYGFVAPTIEKSHAILGGAISLPKEIIQADRQWDAYLPDYEPQSGNGWDTDGCSIWGTFNAEEFLEKKKRGGDPNHSERHVYIGTHTRPPGNDPHVIAEWISANGLVDQSDLPFTATFEEFIQPDPLPTAITSKATLWHNQNDFRNEWVFNGDVPPEDKKTAMMEALQYSPLGVSVTAWIEGPDGIYVSNGIPNCHWCVCYGFTDKGWKIFDSYDHSQKIYSFDADISFSKRYYLAPVAPIVTPLSFCARMKSVFGF